VKTRERNGYGLTEKEITLEVVELRVLATLADEIKNLQEKIASEKHIPRELIKELTVKVSTMLVFTDKLTKGITTPKEAWDALFKPEEEETTFKKRPPKENTTFEE
jgi:hypothetical protein